MHFEVHDRLHTSHCRLKGVYRHAVQGVIFSVRHLGPRADAYSLAVFIVAGAELYPSLPADEERICENSTHRPKDMDS